MRPPIRAWRIVLPNDGGNTVTDQETIANWHKEQGYQVIGLVDVNEYINGVVAGYKKAAEESKIRTDALEKELAVARSRCA